MIYEDLFVGGGLGVVEGDIERVKIGCVGWVGWGGREKEKDGRRRLHMLAKDF